MLEIGLVDASLSGRLGLISMQMADAFLNMDRSAVIEAVGDLVTGSSTPFDHTCHSRWIDLNLLW